MTEVPSRTGSRIDLRDSIKRHPLIAFFALAYVISWILVSPLVLEGLGLTGNLVPPSWHAFGALGPILSAFIVAGATEGRAGVRELLASLRRWRVGRTWFLLAVFSPFLLFVVAAGIVVAFGSPVNSIVVIGPAQLTSLGWIVGIVYGIGEEPGWRGFALPRLQRGRSALRATLILAVFWFLWHTPYFFYRYELGLGLVGLFFGILAGAIWLTCLYNSTDGSTAMTVLWHTTFNLVNLPKVVSSDVLAAMSVLVMVAAVAVVLVFGPRTLSAKGKHEGSTFSGAEAVPRVR
ncbi:MAG: CPBP family intramembrane metalloprotease [Actinomycetota bacterium]|nr:CPBP family intramembrane metalloprotease [Actinomycetota bacterium]